MDDKTKIEEAFSYHEPTFDQVAAMEQIRLAARNLAEVIVSQCPASADRTTAIRKIREAVMTANASIVLNGMI